MDGEQERLFPWEDEAKPRRRRKRDGGVLAERPPGFHLVATRTGVVGWHQCSIPDASFARNHSVVTRCGIVGRIIPDEDWQQIVRCPDCVKKGSW